MNLHFSWVELVGIAAACLSTSSFLPQAWRIWRTRSARDVSLIMYLMLMAGTLVWLTYGALIGSFSLIISNLAGVVMIGSVLVLKIQDLVRPRNLLVEIVEAEASTVTAPPVNSNDVLPSKVPPAAA